MATDIIARGIAAKAAGDLSQFKEETTEALAGKADLQDGKVPASQLPSYVDDVVEYASVEAFPVTGELGKIYVAMDTGYTYRWAGTDYIQIGGQDLSDIVTNFAQNYDNTATYAVGDFCTYENVFYVCSTAIDVAEAWNAAHWTRTTVATVIEARDAQIAALRQSVAKLGADLAPAYDPTLTYKVGDLVMVGDELWKCVTAIDPAEAWNPEHWVKVNVVGVFADKNYFGFKRILAPSSTTLTEEEQTAIVNGCIVDGTFLGLRSPWFLPRGLLTGDGYYGFVVYSGDDPTLRNSIVIRKYRIQANRQIGLNSYKPITISWDQWIKINDKVFPSYPTDLTKAYALEQNASTGALAWNEKLIYGFRKISAPTSTTLTNDEVELFKQGVIIDGTFLSYTNPVFYPASGENNAYHGIFIGTWQAYQFVRDYYIENNVISVGMARISFGQNLIGIDATTVSMNGKAYPPYPSDLTKDYRLSQDATSGNLSWQEADKPLTPAQVKMILQGGNSEITIPFTGETTLTSAYVSECLEVLNASEKAAVTKVIVPAGFTSFDNGCLDNLENVTELEIYCWPKDGMPATSISNANGSIKKLVIHLQALGSSAYAYFTNIKSVTELIIKDLVNIGVNFTFAGSMYDGNWIRLPDTKVISSLCPFGHMLDGNIRVDLPKIESMPSDSSVISDTGVKLFIGTSNCSIGTQGFDYGSAISYAYVPADALVWYMTAPNWSNHTANTIGYLDYNGSNIPTFSGYTATWYSDEDCTTTISTSSFVKGTRYYVKLMAN